MSYPYTSASNGNIPSKKKFIQLCIFSPILCFMGSKLREKSRIKTQSTPIIFASRTRLSSMMLQYGLKQILKNYFIGSPHVFTNFSINLRILFKILVTLVLLVLLWCYVL